MQIQFHTVSSWSHKTETLIAPSVNRKTNTGKVPEQQLPNAPSTRGPNYQSGRASDRTVKAFKGGKTLPWRPKLVRPSLRTVTLPKSRKAELSASPRHYKRPRGSASASEQRRSLRAFQDTGASRRQVIASTSQDEKHQHPVQPARVDTKTSPATHPLY